MLKSVEDISTTKKRLKIEIPSDEIEREIGSSLENLRHKVRIPGFRPGKAPINLIEKRYGKEVEAEVLEKVIPQHYSSALKEAALNPVTTPELEGKFEFKRKNPIHLSFVVEVLPDIENIHYENISVKDIPFSVEDSDIEEALKRLQNQKAIFEVADKEVGMDDLVSFDYVEGEIVAGVSVSNLKEVISNMGNEILPPDIMSIALGKKKDDVIEFTKTFDESAKSKEIAGKTAHIKLSIKEIKKKTLPDIDDEFAKDLGFAGLTELREKLKERIHNAKKDHVQKIQKAEIINKIIEANTVDVPETLLRKELDSLVFDKGVSESREDTVYSDTMSDMIEMESEAESREQKKEDEPAKMKEKALKNVRASVIINAIGKKEGIFVTDDEVNERISLIARRLSATPEAVRSFYSYKEGSLDSLKQSIYEDKVLDALLSKAVIEKEENK